MYVENHKHYNLKRRSSTFNVNQVLQEYFGQNQLRQQEYFGNENQLLKPFGNILNCGIET